MTLLSTSADVPRALVATLFIVGALLALLSILANVTQQGYYRAARQLKGRLEDELQLGELALATTPGMRSGSREESHSGIEWRLKRLGRVRSLLLIMLVAIGVVDIAGFALSLERALSDTDAPVELVARVAPAGSVVSSLPRPVVLSQDGRVVARATLGSELAAILRVRPGTYRLSTYVGRVCDERVEIRDKPLQVVRIACPRHP